MMLIKPVKDIIRHSDRKILKRSRAEKGDITFPQSPATILLVFSRYKERVRNNDKIYEEDKSFSHKNTTISHQLQARLLFRKIKHYIFISMFPKSRNKNPVQSTMLKECLGENDRTLWSKIIQNCSKNNVSTWFNITFWCGFSNASTIYRIRTEINVCATI